LASRGATWRLGAGVVLTAAGVVGLADTALGLAVAVAGASLIGF